MPGPLSSKEHSGMLFLSSFCRSSDSLWLFAFPPSVRQWQVYGLNSTLYEHTAAGLLGIRTQFPFHPTPRTRAAEQNAVKLR